MAAPSSPDPTASPPKIEGTSSRALCARQCWSSAACREADRLKLDPLKGIAPTYPALGEGARHWVFSQRRRVRATSYVSLTACPKNRRQANISRLRAEFGGYAIIVLLVALGLGMSFAQH